MHSVVDTGTKCAPNWNAVSKGTAQSAGVDMRNPDSTSTKDIHSNFDFNCRGSAHRAFSGAADTRPMRSANDGHWKHLAPRSDSWRKQFYLKDRNVTVGQLVGSIQVSGLTAEQASDDFGLPLEVIKEALTYFEQNRALILREAAAERKWLEENGCRLEPPNPA